MMKKQKQDQKQQEQEELPEGPLVEIQSLCRFKCVSRPWLALCSDPEIRKRCPQTLSGFFYNTTSSGLSFCNLSGRSGTPMVDPSLPFLQGRYACIQVEQCCGGLLLCRYWKSYRGRNKARFGFAVCNPATGQWDVLPTIVLPNPDDGAGSPVIYEDIDEFFLAFDAANPSRFVVFAPLYPLGDFAQVAIFSSETRRWTSVENGWGVETVLVGNLECVLLNGIMHLATDHGAIVTVDMEGKVWREIGIPDGTSYPSIGQSQGCLYAWQIDDDDNNHKLSVWVLEDYASGKWTLKHTANLSQLLGRQLDWSYIMFAIHPDCNVVFLTSDKEKMTVSYDMDTRKVHVICTYGEFLDAAPYVPCFMELLLR